MGHATRGVSLKQNRVCWQGECSNEGHLNASNPWKPPPVNFSATLLSHFKTLLMSSPGRPPSLLGDEGESDQRWYPRTLVCNFLFFCHEPHSYLDAGRPSHEWDHCRHVSCSLWMPRCDIVMVQLFINKFQWFVSINFICVKIQSVSWSAVWKKGNRTNQQS